MGWFDWVVGALSAGFEQEMNRRAVRFFGGRFDELGTLDRTERPTRAEGTSRTGLLVVAIDADSGNVRW